MVTVATFISIINQILPEPHAGLLAGILFGTKKAVSKDLLDALTITGTNYLVVFNGVNISVLAGLSMTTLLRFFPRRVASFLTILFLAFFVWFVGPTPGALRAAIMGSLTLLAVAFGRQKWPLLFYGVTIAIMLMAQPSWIGNLSFQLSALATLGIILFAKKSTSYVKDSLLLTLSAQVFTIPLILFTFHQISLVSPLTNILIFWIIAPLTVIGMALALLGWIWLPLGYVFGWVSWVLLEYVILVTHWTAKLPFAILKL